MKPTQPSELKKVLENAGMSQTELAKRIGVTRQYISQIVGGKRLPTEANREAIRNALGLSPDALAGMPISRRVRFDASVRLAEMEGIDVAYLRTSMDALIEARRILLLKSPKEALRRAAGKGDTKMFDAITESAITGRLRRFDGRCAVFTEEGNVTDDGRGGAGQACFFIDPLDRSKPFADTLAAADDQCDAIADLVGDEDYPLRGLLAPYGSISFVREGQITFNVMIDYQSGELFVACRAMTKHGHLERCPDPERMVSLGEDITFGPRGGSDFVCFVGEKGTRKGDLYAQHLLDLPFRGEGNEPQPIYAEPGGPARILYLASRPDLEFGQEVACVLSNGEKICEWFGWLAYVSFSNSQLAVYELYAQKLSSRDMILLAPPPNYSLFTVSDDYRCSLNLDRITMLDIPVYYRSALVVAHEGSTEILAEMDAQKKSRKLRFGRRDRVGT